MDFDRKDAERHLHFLFDRYHDGWVEFRGLRKPANPFRTSVRLNALFGGIDLVFAELQTWLDHGADIYLGVLPREVSHLASGKVGEEYIAQMGVLWTDLDRKVPGASLEQLARCDLVVDSGNGWHGYSSAPTIFEADTRERRKMAKKALRSYADRITPGTDNVSDLTRILRLAGTWNFKDPANPKPVRIVEVQAKPRPAVIAKATASSVANPPDWTEEEEATYRRIRGLDSVLSTAGRYRERDEPWPDGSALEDRYSWVIRILQRMMARGDSKASILEFAALEGISKAEVQSARLALEESDANL